MSALDRDPIPLRQFNPNVPADLETICLKCLEKEPAKRYPTAQALADELGGFLHDEPKIKSFAGPGRRTSMMRAEFWASKAGDSTGIILSPGANGMGHERTWRNFRGRSWGIESSQFVPSLQRGQP